MLLVLVSVHAGASDPGKGDERACSGWSPPETRRQVVVEDVGELFRAATYAEPDTTIRIEPGRYRLPRMLDLSTRGLIVTGRTGDPKDVVLHGNGMTEREVGVALSVSAPDITIAGLTVRDVGYHGIQVRGEQGASGVVVRDVRIVDTGQQLLKGSVSRNGRHADGGLVACSLFEYSSHAPGTYTNAIDVLAADDWIVRDNEIRNIRGPEGSGWKAGPAILFWANSRGTTVRRNLVVDSYRGIAFGLGPGISRYARDGEKRYDHQGGVIADNVVVNRHDWADEGIEVSAARDVLIENNEAFVGGGLPWAISLRFPSTSGVVRGNVTNRPVVLRDGARARRSDNVVDVHAHRQWVTPQ